MEFDGQNTMQAKYTHSDRTDEVMFMERPTSPHTNDLFSAQRYYYHHDRLGSVTEVTNSSGDVVQRYVYDSFGNTNIYDKDGTAITEASTDYLKTPYTFTSRERDPETGLHYHRARYYDTIAGRWISSDPIGFDSGDTNFYRYVGNNSRNYVDPSGNNPVLIVIGGIIVTTIIFNDQITDYICSLYPECAESKYGQEIRDKIQRDIKMKTNPNNECPIKEENDDDSPRPEKEPYLDRPGQKLPS